MVKSDTKWKDYIKNRSSPISTPHRSYCLNAPFPLEPVKSKSERKRIERWRNSEVTSWIDYENKKPWYGYTEIFEMEL